MKVFEDFGRINFVDENNVFVGFCNDGKCCEVFGYVFVKVLPEAVNGNKTKGSVELSELELKDFNFDVNFSKELEVREEPANWDRGGGGAISFRLVNNLNEEIYLILFNHHNGWYSHGFEMKDNEKLIFDGCL